MIRGVLAAALALSALPAAAQMDPSKRLQLEGGFERGVGAPGPVAPYAYLYMNHPGVFGSSTTLRLALAPVYVDSELGLTEAMPRTDVGLGISGGGYAFGQTEVYRGTDLRGESFMGHGGGPSLSFYPRLGKVGPVPINGVVRVGAAYANYERDSKTDAAFQLPPDEWTGFARFGIRAGGSPPGLNPGPAGEVSAWLERRDREHGGVYGINGDREARRRSHLYWTRGFVSLPLKNGSLVAGGFSLGDGDGVDRFSAYRLGGMLTMNAEFPLIIPGYFSHEIAATSYAHVWAREGVPLDEQHRYVWSVFAAGAGVKPVRGTDPGGTYHGGVGVALGFMPKRAALRGEFSYGYSPTALRGRRRGGHGVALTMELNFNAPGLPSRARLPSTQEGLRWLLGPFNP